MDRRNIPDFDIPPIRLPKNLGTYIVGAVVIVLGVILLASGLYTVDTDAEAVVLRFGKASRVVGPGLHFKIPFGVERSVSVPTSRH